MNTKKDYNRNFNFLGDDRIGGRCPDQRNIPELAISAKAIYLSYLYNTNYAGAAGKTTDDRWRLALATYNAGQGTVDNELKQYGHS